MKVFGTILSIIFLVITWAITLFFAWPWMLGVLAEKMFGVDEDTFIVTKVAFEIPWLIILVSVGIWYAETYGPVLH